MRHNDQLKKYSRRSLSWRVGETAGTGAGSCVGNNQKVELNLTIQSESSLSLNLERIFCHIRRLVTGGRKRHTSAACNAKVLSSAGSYPPNSVPRLANREKESFVVTLVRHVHATVSDDFLACRLSFDQ